MVTPLRRGSVVVRATTEDSDSQKPSEKTTSARAENPARGRRGALRHSFMRRGAIQLSWNDQLRDFEASAGFTQGMVSASLFRALLTAVHASHDADTKTNRLVNKFVVTPLETGLSKESAVARAAFHTYWRNRLVSIGERRHKFVRMLFLMFVPPLVASFQYAYVNYGDAYASVWDQRMYFFLWIPVNGFIGGAGSGALACTAFNIPIGATFLVPFTATFVCVHFALGLAAGVWWGYPVPGGLVWISGVAVLFATVLSLYNTFGALIFTDEVLVKRLALQAIIPLMCILYLALFVWYLYQFSRLSASSQILFAPLWSCFKFALKELSMYIMDVSGNPEATGFMNFAFDALSSMNANVLFCAVSDIASVAPLLYVDVVENGFITYRALRYLREYGHSMMKADILRAEQNRFDGLIASFEDKHEVFEKRYNKKLSEVRGCTERMRLDSEETKSLSSCGSGSCAAPTPSGGPEKRASLKSREGVRARHRTRWHAGDMYHATTNREIVDLERKASQNLNKALVQILILTSSELSEIVTSFWMTMTLPLIYYGVNKESFYVIEDLDDKGFRNSMMLSLLDGCLEGCLFIFFAVTIQYYTRVDIIKLWEAYLRETGLITAFALVNMLVPVVTISFFFRHVGIDPTMEYKWLRE